MIDTIEGIEYRKRLQELNDKAYNKTITKAEKDELVDLLYQMGKINEQMYQNYQNDRFSDSVFKGVETIAGILLFGWLLGKVFN